MRKIGMNTRQHVQALMIGVVNDGIPLHMV
jgi:hypothetical protein